MAGSLDGKVALVTGASSGIGAATAKIFAREGASVALLDMNVDGGQRIAAEIQSGGGDAMFVQVDVSDEEEVRSAIEQTVNRFGRLDCAFNNAGIGGGPGSLVDSTREVWDRVIAVNLTGVWLCVQQEISQMLENGGGSIVNTASVVGLIGFGAGAYAASKHGVIGITRSAAKGYGSARIRVNAVCPGVIETPLAAPLIDDPTMSEMLLLRHALGRFGEPREVGEVVAWLCSDAASFVTGVAMPVDAGWTA